MSNIVNLRAARKDKARAEKEKAAQANRVKFGRTKAQRKADEAEGAAMSKRVDGAYREHRPGEEADG